jgi:HlyD family secretion protein
LPTGALFREGEHWAAYRIDGDRARMVHLELGRNNGETAEVLSGLSENDQVILHPSDRIKENTLVERR